MFSIDQTIERACNLLKKEDWNPYRLSKKAGLSPNALSKIGTDAFSPTLRTLRKIALALDEIDAEGRERSGGANG